jgi:hypothetical protein
VKAFSLWQPWASLMAAGLKTIETRSWSTAYRGPLAIHAAKRPLTVDEHELIHRWVGMKLLSLDWLTMRLPFGAIVAVVELVNCLRTIDLVASWYQDKHFPNEQEFGNYTAGRWAWTTRDLRPLAQPVPWRGAQGLLDVPDVILEQFIKA